MTTSRILVTGGRGFLGQHVVNWLQEQGHAPYVFSSRDCDLTDYRDVARLLDQWNSIDVVYHLAARVGGIRANQAFGANFYRDNVLMDTHVLTACSKGQVGKIILVGSNCSYPRDAPVPFVENDIFNGYPEETNGPYGVAKRGLLAYYWACRQQFGLKGAYLILANLYGPGSEGGERSHVISAMLRKMQQAKQDGRPVVLWGTGRASRDFLNVRDAAEALILAANKLDDSRPINIGSGTEVTISELSRLVADVVGYQGPIEWDASKPDGHPRRCLNTQLCQALLGWQPRIALRDGLCEMARLPDAPKDAR